MAQRITLASADHKLDGLATCKEVILYCILRRFMLLVAAELHLYANLRTISPSLVPSVFPIFGVEAPRGAG